VRDAREERGHRYFLRSKVKRHAPWRAKTMAGFTRSALARAVMRDPAVSADPDARRKWRNERKRARRAS